SRLVIEFPSIHEMVHCLGPVFVLSELGECKLTLSAKSSMPVKHHTSADHKGQCEGHVWFTMKRTFIEFLGTPIED
ncbi:hypothetical protein HAX54_022506, partial [Datura stramonium]|nr:hypothetical protein [Datura stramonium]